ncbi:MAG: LysM peptidoglycan-binding domain-containing protein [Anaerolineae bacterium]|nr:LysM peptidoglycan-binding domain-containing protein [Anaerolineae bacterium]
MLGLRINYRRLAPASVLLCSMILTACGQPPGVEHPLTAATVLADPDAYVKGGLESEGDQRTSIAITPGMTPPLPLSPTPTRQPPEVFSRTYTVRGGDTLSGIAMAVGLSVETLMQANGLGDADQLVVGQVLEIPLEARLKAPEGWLIPDSELVYGPTFADFDVAEATADFPGWFGSYTEMVDYETLSAAEIVELVATQYSVGPRVLLTLLELQSGWLTHSDPTADARLYPLGYYQPGWDGLLIQLSWAANTLNAGFYGWLQGNTWTFPLADGTFVEIALSANAGAVGVQRFLAAVSPDYDTFVTHLDSFATTYERLWGDPYAYALEPLLPTDLQAPVLTLPWPQGATWYLTSGPHGGWGSGSARAALDFVTDERNLGCYPSQQWATAVAAGPVIFSDGGMVLQDLDADGFVGSGWILMYMHMAAEGCVTSGAYLDVGDPVGRPSCEGGVSNASHLHLARRYNGVWIPASHPRWPMALEGWIPGDGELPYDGTLTRGSEVRTAAETWSALNAIQH